MIPAHFMKKSLFSKAPREGSVVAACGCNSRARRRGAIAATYFCSIGGVGSSMQQVPD